MLSVSRAAPSAASASRSSKDRVANAGLGAAEQPAKPASPPMTNARRDGRGGGGRIEVPQMMDEIMRSCMSDLSPAAVTMGSFLRYLTVPRVRPRRRLNRRNWSRQLGSCFVFCCREVERHGTPILASACIPATSGVFVKSRHYINNRGNRQPITGSLSKVLSKLAV